MGEEIKGDNHTIDTDYKRKYKTYTIYEVVDGEKEKRYIDVEAIVVNDRPLMDYLNYLRFKCNRLWVFTLLNIILTAFLISKLI